MQKFKLKTTAYSICSSKGSGPKFGGGHDLDIVGNCNTTENYYHNINHSYDFTTETCTKEDFLGSTTGKFLVTDYEVYRVV